MKKIILLALSGILSLFAYSQGSTVRVINVQGLNTYRLEVLNKGEESKQKIIGTTYNHEIYASNLNGEILWKKQTGGYCFDMCTQDLTGNGFDEVILGCGDDKVYCYDSSGQQLWATNLQAGPIYSVATITSGGKQYVLAGTVLNDLFILNADGTINKRKKFYGSIREILVCDFNKDGIEGVYIDRAPRDNTQYGAIYAFPSLSPNSSFTEIELGVGRADHGQNATVLKDGNGKGLIFYEKGYIDPLDSMTINSYNNKGFQIIKDTYAGSYRARYIDAGKYLPSSEVEQVMVAYGDDLYHYSSNGKLLGYVRAKLSFNDVVTASENGQDKVLLAGAPNGDDNLYLISMDNNNQWLSDIAELDWTGHMKSIVDEYASIQNLNDNWNGTPVDLPSDDPIIVQVNGEQGNGLNESTMEANIERWKKELAYYYRKFPYPKRIKFAFRINLYEDWTGYFQYQTNTGEWVTKSKGGLSKETILKFARRMEDEGIPFYTKAHGIQVSLDTYKEMMDVAPNAFLGVGIVEYGFAYSHLEENEKGKKDYFIRDFILPLLDYAKLKDKHVWFHCKGATWTVRTQMYHFQHGIMGEKYKDVLIMSSEDSNSRTPDLNTAARVGAWYAGYVHNWGYRWVSDIPAFSRFWDWSRTNTGHPASRSLLTAVSLGSTYLNICSRQYDSNNSNELPSMATGVEQFLHLLGKGIISPPKRENLLNISPVTLSLKEDLVEDVYWGGSGGHDFNFKYETHPGYTNPNGFGLVSKISVEWGCATTADTDWASYTYGRYQQAHNHIPNLSHGFGYAPIVPNPNERPDIDISYFTTQLVSNGEDAAVNGIPLSLDAAREKVLEEMEIGTENTEMFPVLVSGDVFSSVNRIAENHYLVYIIDPNLMSPVKDCTCSIKANKSGNWIIKDRLSNKELGSLEQPVPINVPAGTFRILEVY